MSFQKYILTTLLPAGESKLSSDGGVNKTLVRREVIRFVNNMLSTIIAKPSEAGGSGAGCQRGWK